MASAGAAIRRQDGGVGFASSRRQGGPLGPRPPATALGALLQQEGEEEVLSLARRRHRVAGRVEAVLLRLLVGHRTGGGRRSDEWPRPAGRGRDRGCRGGGGGGRAEHRAGGG